MKRSGGEMGKGQPLITRSSNPNLLSNIAKSSNERDYNRKSQEAVTSICFCIPCSQ